MKAEDTVIKDISNPYTWMEGSAICFNDTARAYLEGCKDQAEISFEAGMREVVGTLKREKILPMGSYWHNKLKEWGIDG